MAEIRECLLADGLDAAETSQPLRKPSVPKKGCYWYVLPLAGICIWSGSSYHRSMGSTTQLESDGLTDWGDAKCYTYTGQSCRIFGCADDFNAKCTHAGRCWCETGCVGSDGRCRPNITQYEIVGEKVKFLNQKYKHQGLYAPDFFLFQQLRTADIRVYKWFDYNWNIYQLPGDMWVPKGKYGSNNHTSGYFISPEKYPTYVGAIAASKFSAKVPMTGDLLNPQTHSVDTGMSVKLGSEWVVDLYDTKRISPFHPELLLNSLCRPHGYPDAVKIFGAFGKIGWYEHLGSWLLYGWEYGDMRKEGVWFPDPPLRIDLPECPIHDD